MKNASQIQVVKVEKGAYGTYAHLRQEHTSSSSSSSKNITTGLDAIVKKTEYTEVRTLNLTVADNTTLEQVQEAFAALPNARIYRMLSLSPIVDAGNKARIDRGQTTEKEIADAQCVAPNGTPALFEHAGNKFKQFRKLYLDTQGTIDDQDLRAEDAEDGNIYQEAAPVALAASLDAIGAVVETPAPVASN